MFRTWWKRWTSRAMTAKLSNNVDQTAYSAHKKQHSHEKAFAFIVDQQMCMFFLLQALKLSHTTPKFQWTMDEAYFVYVWHVCDLFAFEEIDALFVKDRTFPRRSWRIAKSVNRFSLNNVFSVERSASTWEWSDIVQTYFMSSSLYLCPFYDAWECDF